MHNVDLIDDVNMSSLDAKDTYSWWHKYQDKHD